MRIEGLKWQEWEAVEWRRGSSSFASKNEGRIKSLASLAMGRDDGSCGVESRKRNRTSNLQTSSSFKKACPATLTLSISAESKMKGLRIPFEVGHAF